MEDAHRERWRLLEHVVALLELPMTVLGLVWLVLLAVDFIRGLHGTLAAVSTGIWILFAADFALELLIAPDRKQYLKHHWAMALSLVFPALRVVRFASVLRVTRASGAIRGVHSLAVLNRGLAALGATMRRRGFAYVSLLTLFILFTGAAGIYTFENVPGPQGIHDYGTAVWWTAMLMTTLGPTSWPVTTAGRILCFFLGLYTFTVFGYVTATLASFFIDRDADRSDAAVASQKSIDALHLRLDELQKLVEKHMAK